MNSFAQKKKKLNYKREDCDCCGSLHAAHTPRSSNFILYKGHWGSGAPKGTDVMERHNIAVTEQVINDQFEKSIVELTPDQLAALVADSEIDILITRSYVDGWKLLAIDKAGKKFGQR